MQWYRRIAEALPAWRALQQVSHDVVVERVRAVAKLVATARVTAGIDLSQGTDVSIDSVAKRITVSLPPSQVMSIDVLTELLARDGYTVEIRRPPVPVMPVG